MPQETYTTRSFQTVNPFTGQVEKVFPNVSDVECLDLLSLADTTYNKDWRLRSVSSRAALMGGAAKIFRDKAEEYAQIACVEVGKLIQQARFEIMVSANILEYYATHAEKFLTPLPLPEAPGAEVVSEPLGVILAIEPWNFPYYQLARVVGPQLVAGNVLMMKHAPNAPQCALAFARLFEEAGFPPGVYTNLFCSVEQIGILIDDFRVRGVTLTGSVAAGISVGERAGRKLKKAVLELGGSDPFIVLEDADMEKVLAVAPIARLVNMGQACLSSKRFIVVGKERAEQFLDRMTKVFQSLKAGDPSDESTTLGPIVSERQLESLLKQVQRAVENGATIVIGGKRIDRPGFYMEPTIITDIAEDNPLFNEECFGPILSFYCVADEEEAIKIANGTQYGLGSEVWSQDTERARRVADRLEAGMVFINSMGYTGPEVPFGGVKNSGYGRELAELGIKEFLNQKLIRVSPD